MELNEDELSVLAHTLDELGDKMYHYPHDYGDPEKKALGTLQEKVNAEAKKLRLWWAV